jgi:transcriptional/translational regulatory protein YebC/TACO1
MSGHSKWATTKHRKAAVDAKRSKLFSKLSRVITVAAKTGGDPNPENNASLAAAIDKAKSYSLPKDKIKNAIDKAFAAGGGAEFEEIVYEGYGPVGIAFYVECLTDNRNRTAADAGGEDMEEGDEDYIVTTAPADLMAVKTSLEAAGVVVKGAELTMHASNETELGIVDARKVMRLVDGLEELDDVQEVYQNMAMTEELAAQLDE